MHLFVTILLVFCTLSLAPSEARGGRGGGGGRSSGGGWRSSGSSSGSSYGSSSSSSGSSYGSSSSSSGSSYGSPSSSSGSSYGSSGSHWDSPYGSSGSHWDSPSPKRDNPLGSSQSSGKVSPNTKQTDPFDSPSSSMQRSIKPGRQTNPSDDPVLGDHDGPSPSSSVSSARLWRRRSWVRHSRSQSDSQSTSEGDPKESISVNNTENEEESTTPTVYDMFPSCENLGEAMWMKYDEFMQSGEMNSDGCQGDDSDVCIRQDIEKVRCAVTENIQQECIDEIMTFMRGGDICAGADKDDLS